MPKLIESILFVSGLLVVVASLGLFDPVIAAPLDRNARDFAPEKCLGPPFLYVTFHGGSGKKNINNVMRYTRDGCSLGTVLNSSDAKDLNELRGIALIPAEVPSGDYLLVANANELDSRVVLYGVCNPNNNQYRPFLSNLVLSSSTNPGLSHPYAIRVHPPPPDYQSLANSSLYVSNQDSGLITYYNLKTGQPSAISQYLAASGSYPPGSFAKIDQATGASFRGFAFNTDDGTLWAADDVTFTSQYNVTTGEPMSRVSLTSPIGVDFYTVNGKELLFISSNAQSSTNDMVYAYDPETLEIVQTYGPEKLDHPAGFVAYDDVLYVLSQNSASIVSFNLTSGAFLDVIIEDLQDQPEQVILAYC